MREKKILYIVPNLYVSSGVSEVIMNYYRNINQEEFKIDFLVIKKYNETYEQEIKNNNSKIFYLKNKFTMYNIIKINKELDEFFNKSEYDIVELHAPTFSFIFLKVCKKWNIPIRIIHTHSTIRSSNYIKNLISKILNKKFKMYTNNFFACSEKSGEYWFENEIRKSSNYKVIKNGINIEKYKFNEELRIRLRKQYNLENNIVIGFVGRISKEKNLSFLIKVIKQIVKENSSYKFLFVGDGKELGKLKKESNYIKNNVLFLGASNCVNELLNCMDLLVLPSKREGLPMVAIEAQLTNLQCFLSDTITKEVDIGATKFLKLDKKLWKKEILGFKKENKIINRYEFDIQKCAKELEKIYIELYNKNRGEKIDI